MAMDKLFKGILQYSAEQFKSVTKEAGYIYLVRTDTTKTDGDAEIWFGTRRYGNVEATRLDDLTQRLETAEGDITTIKGQIGDWVKDMGTIATVVSGHDTKIKSLEDSLKEGGDTANAIKEAKDAADAAQGEVDTLEGVVATKAAQSDLDALAGRVGTAETDIDNLEKSLAEGGATAQAIKAAKDAADAAQGEVDALEKVVGDGFSETKTVASEIARVEGIADAARTEEEVNAQIDAKIEGLNSASHTHSNKDELDKFVDGDKAKWDGHVANADIHVTAEQKKNWQDATDAINAFLDENATKDEVINTLVEIREYLDGEDGAVPTLLGDVASIKESLAEGGATAQAIKAAKDAADAAQGEVDALEKVVGDGFSETKTVASEIARVEGIADAARTEEEVNAQIDAKIEGLNSASHTHDNKALLDTYTQTEANLADAVSKKHEHTNKSELDKFVDGDKAKLDAAVQTVSVAEGCEMLSATKEGTTVTLALYYGGGDAE